MTGEEEKGGRVRGRATLFERRRRWRRLGQRARDTHTHTSTSSRASIEAPPIVFKATTPPFGLRSTQRSAVVSLGHGLGVVRCLSAVLHSLVWACPRTQRPIAVDFMCWRIVMIE